MSSVYRKTIITLLKESGARLIRHTKHKIYRLPNGKNYVESSTPSAPSDLNRLNDLRKRLDLPNTRGQEGERRDKKPKQTSKPAPTKYQTFEGASFAEKLQLQGLKESALQTEIDRIKDELAMLVYNTEVITEQHNTQIQTLNTLVEEERQARCWICKLKNKFRAKIEEEITK